MFFLFSPSRFPFVIKGGDKLTLSVTGPSNNSVTNPVLKAEANTDNKRCTTPVTVTFFGHSDRGKLEKVILPSLEQNKKQQPLSLLTNSSDADSSENDLNSLSPKNNNNQGVFFGENNTNSTNPFAHYLTENVPFHESNPFLSNNPFRNEDNGTTSDGQSELDSLSSNKEVSLLLFFVLPRTNRRFCVIKWREIVNVSKQADKSM